jgi:hypothetical protein
MLRRLHRGHIYGVQRGQRCQQQGSEEGSFVFHGSKDAGNSGVG